MGGGNEAWMVLLVSIAQETGCQKEIRHKGRGPRTRVENTGMKGIVEGE